MNSRPRAGGPVSLMMGQSLPLPGPAVARRKPSQRKKASQPAARPQPGAAPEVVPAAASPDPAPAETPPADPPFPIVLRGQHEPRSRGRVIADPAPLAALQLALNITDHPAAEPVLEWQEVKRLAALDVDYHDRPLEQRPEPDSLAALAAVIRPRPALWWTTHGRGLRLIYAAHGGLTADELAACARLSVRSLDPVATAEILAHTRHPAYPRPGHPAAGPVGQGTATAELGPLGRWLSLATPEDQVEDWLAEQGLARGGKYPHDRCPADPGAPSHGEPVFVNEEGIYCHRCAATGLCLGGRRPGFFPWRR